MSKVNEIVFNMDYIGKVLSVNHFKYGLTIYTRKEVKTWMEVLGWRIKASHIEEWRLPLKVRCDGIFKNRAAQPDLSNLSKVILDAIEETTGVNDRDMRWEDGDVSYGPPMLWITISEAKGEL